MIIHPLRDDKVSKSATSFWMKIQPQQALLDRILAKSSIKNSLQRPPKFYLGKEIPDS